MIRDNTSLETSIETHQKQRGRNKQTLLTNLLSTTEINALTNTLNIINNSNIDRKTRKSAKRYLNCIRSGYITIRRLEELQSFISKLKGRVLLMKPKKSTKPKRIKAYSKVKHSILTPSEFKVLKRQRLKPKSNKRRNKPKSKSDYVKEAEKLTFNYDEDDHIPDEHIPDEEPIAEEIDDVSSDEYSDSESEEEQFETHDWEFVQIINKNGVPRAPHYELKFFVNEYGSIERTIKAIIHTLKSLDEEIMLGTHNYFIDFYFKHVSHSYSHLKLNTEKYSENQSKAKALIKMLENTIKTMNTEELTSDRDFININEACRFQKYEEMAENHFNLLNFEGAIIKRYVNLSEIEKFETLSSSRSMINGRSYTLNSIERAHYLNHHDNNPGFFRYHYDTSTYMNNTLVNILHELQIYTSSDDMVKCDNHKTPCFVQSIIYYIQHTYNPPSTEMEELRLSLMLKQTTKYVNIAKMNDALLELHISLTVTEIKISDLSKTYSKAHEPMKRTVNNKRVNYFGADPSTAKYKVSTFMVDKHMFADLNIPKAAVNDIDCKQLKLKGKGVSEVSTGKLVYTLFVNKMFKLIDLSSYNILRSHNHEQVVQRISTLILNETTLKPYSEIQRSRHDSDKQTIVRLWFADFEAFTNRFTTSVHEPFMICFCNESSDIITMSGPSCATSFLDYIVEDTRKYRSNIAENIRVETVVYFHNLSYDINFLANKGIRTSINNGTNYFAASIYHKGVIIKFKDSLKLISTKLENFPKMFKLKCGQKEVFPYDLYTAEHLYKTKRWPIDKADEFEKERWTQTKKSQFRANVESITNCKHPDDTFDLYIYAQFYCEQDVRILREGLLKFDSLCEEALGIKATSKLSISSLANAYLEANVYSHIANDLYFLGGPLMLYTKKYINGGRTMCAYNKAWIMNDPCTPIVDFDAVSLYPSAMNRLDIQGGKPEVITVTEAMKETIYDHIPDELKCFNSYLIEIDIVSVNNHYAFPLTLKRDSILTYSVNTDDPIKGNFYEDIGIDNDHPLHQYVDNYKLEDLVNFHQIKFRLHSEYLNDNTIGLGWKGNKYDVLKPCIQRLFNERLKYKAEDNPLQEVLKLIMNSIYGKMIESEHIHNYVYKRDESKLDKDGKYSNEFMKYISRNNYKIIEYTPILNSDGTDSSIMCVKVVAPIHKCFRNVLTGIQVLSMSKRVINEVTCTAHDNGIPMFYTDTDSMHLYHHDLTKLANVYEERFGRNLIGKQLGQFHSDFPTFGTSKNMPLSIYSNFVSKKFYIDILRNDKDEYYPFVRCKGIPNDCIKDYVIEHYNKTLPTPIPKDDFELCLAGEYTPHSKTICDMYKQYYIDVSVNGKRAEYNLAAKHLKLKKSIALQIKTLNNFPRTVRSRYVQGNVDTFFKP